MLLIQMKLTVNEGDKSRRKVYEQDAQMTVPKGQMCVKCIQKRQIL